MTFPLTLADINCNGKKVLIREDFNVPIEAGKILDTTRIKAAIPGIQQILKQNGQVILMSHFGRPKEGIWQEEYSLLQIKPCLEQLLQEDVTFLKEWPPEIPDDSKIILLENVRFLTGEVENSPTLAKQMASLCDIFVFDAFGSAHRAHASTVGVVKYVKLAAMGPLVAQEVAALNTVMHNPKTPVVAIIGGAKVSSKLKVLQTLKNIVDVLIVGGGMANTLLAAKGIDVGQSLYEADMLQAAKELLQQNFNSACEIVLPVDVVTESTQVKELHSLAAQDKILDIGSATIELYSSYIRDAATILWNGPLGMFENPKFAKGTYELAECIANSRAYTVAGGGETLAAIANLGLENKFTYLSTGGGAFLEYIENASLPAIDALINTRIQHVKTY